jgi:hypothetical protein
MENWDFHEWQAALAAIGPRAAALVGLAAAERIAGCLNDQRFRRHGGPEADMVRELLDECWTAVSGESDSARIRELAELVEDYSATYLNLSLMEMFHSYGPFDDGKAPDLEEFLPAAEPEGAVVMHFDALLAVSEAATACAGGAWDGALRCLQSAAEAGPQGTVMSSGPGSELRRQRDDLARVAAEGADIHVLVADLRAGAQEGAAGWRQAAEYLALLRD